MNPPTLKVCSQRVSSPLVIVLMGIAGSGKTTVGQRLAAILGWNFRDADGFHPAANIDKMSSGVPLTDEDRAPWLSAIRAYIDECLACGESAVVTCSALRKAYQQKIVGDPARVKLVHLQGDPALILQRISGREGHFMRKNMLQSQIETLEAPDDAVTVDIAQSPDAIADQIRKEIGI